MPTISTKKPKAQKQAIKSKAAMERDKLVLLIAGGVLALTIVIHLVAQLVSVIGAGSKMDEDIAARKTDRAMKLAEEDEIFQEELSIAMQAQKENLAAANRAAEFSRRRDLDPALAVSEREKNMLRMKEVGSDASLSPQDALEKLARLASPPGSGIMVTETKSGYQVDVAFPYRAVVKDFRDLYGSYLPGMAEEVRRVTAGIILDIFRFGMTRNVKEVRVRCQDYSIIKEGRKEKKEIRDWFVAYGFAERGDWSNMSREQVQRVWKVKVDQYH